MPTDPFQERWEAMRLNPLDQDIAQMNETAAKIGAPPAFIWLGDHWDLEPSLRQVLLDNPDVFKKFGL